jgi:hypothetical protein
MLTVIVVFLEAVSGVSTSFKKWDGDGKVEGRGKEAVLFREHHPPRQLGAPPRCADSAANPCDWRSAPECCAEFNVAQQVRASIGRCVSPIHTDNVLG